jgi:hypothetical protein
MAVRPHELVGDRRTDCARLDDGFGPLPLGPRGTALVVVSETAHRIDTEEMARP